MNMKCLFDLSAEAALRGDAFGPAHRAPLSLERAITAAHRRLAGAAPAERELAILRLQFPALLQPIEPGDLLAGRILYPLVSFGPEPGGLGYDCREEVVRRVLAERVFTAAEREETEAMLEYWRGRTTTARTRAAYPDSVREVLPSDDWTTEPRSAFPLYRLAGTVLDYAKLVRLGLPGLATEIETRRQELAPDDTTGPAFLRGLAEALRILAGSLRHYATQASALAQETADPARRAELRRIAHSLAALEDRAPQTLHEGLQLVWLFALHSGTWNYGRADLYLGPLLARDLAARRLTEPAALDLLRSWWRLIRAYDNQYNNRVCIGGLGRPDAAAADRFALLALEATRLERRNQPQLTLRFHRGQNPALLDTALTLLGEGVTFPLLYNDDVNVPAVAKAFRVSTAEAEQYQPFGCGEYVLAHRSVGSPNGVLNLAMCVETVLHRLCPPDRAAAAPASFAEVWAAYAAEVERHLVALAQQERIEYEVAAADSPFLFLSLLHDDCIARARPLFSGGARHLGGTVETYGNTNAADALRAIHELVFLRRHATLREVAAACAADFAGPKHERLRRLLAAVPKYGNDDTAADTMARRVHLHVCETARRQATAAGLHSYLVVIINNWANVVLGANTGATPDGRRAGAPLANGNNPAPGADRSGVTAFLNSLAKLDPEVHAGAVQNMKFSREFFTRSRRKLEALLAGYWRAGGTQAMITVVSPDDLRAALAEPDKWGHLMVRVGGFSARFVDLPRGAQEEVLQRTCHA